MKKAKEIKTNKFVRVFGVCKQPKKWKAHRIFGNSDKVEVVEV